MNRIRKMIAGIQQAKDGNYAVRLETSGHGDELDLLAEAVNHLLDQMQESQAAGEQKKEALEESQERYRRLEANIPGMVYTFKFEAGERHVFPYANERSRELFGIEPEDLRRDGSLLADLIHPDDRERRDASIIQSLKTLQPWRQELRHIVDGEVRWYDCMSRPERQPDGEILWSGIILETTDRKRAEEKLSQNLREMTLLHRVSHLVSSSLSLNDVVQAIVAGIKETLDPDLVIIFLKHNESLHLRVVSPKNSPFKPDFVTAHRVGECLCGLAAQDGQPIYSFDISTDPCCDWEECKKAGLRSFAALPLKSGDKVLGVLSLASNKPRNFAQEAPFLETLAVEISLGLRNSLLLEDATIRADELAQEISEHQQTEAALRESEVRFRHVVEFSPLPIGIIEDDVPEYVNPKFVETFGYTLEDLPNLAAWFRLAYPDAAYRQSVMESWQTAMKKAVAENRATEGLEVKVTCKDGSVRDVQVWSVPMGSKILTFCHDFTERKRAEEALEKRLVALSRPLDEAEDLNFEDLFDLNDLQRIQDLYAKVTGVTALITTPDGTPITQPSSYCRFCRDIIQQSELGASNCRVSEELINRYSPDGPIIQHCQSAGLCNASASITVGGKHVANWLIGQVRDGTQDDETLRAYARTLGIDEEEFMAAFHEVPVMTQEQFNQVAQAHFVLANQLSSLAYQNIQQARFITERQRAEKELGDSEERLRLALKAANQGLFDLNVKTGEVQFTPEYASMLGYDPAEFQLSLDRWQESLHPDDRESTVATYQAYIHGEIPDFAVEFRQRTASGDLKWILSLGKIVAWDDEGKPLRMLGTHTDITERKQAEEELRQYRDHLENLVAERTAELSLTYQSLVENEARYRLLAENITDVIWIMDFNLQFTYLSPSIELLRGFTPQETMAQSLEEIFPPESLKTIRQVLEEELSRDQQGTGELAWFRESEVEMRCQDGSTIWVEIRASLIRDLKLQAVGILGVARDITRRRHAEEALRESEARFRTIFTHSPLGIVLRDLEGRLLEANPAALKILGHSFEEIFGSGHDFVHPDDFPRYQELMEGMQRDQADYGEMELRAQRRDGTWAWGRLHLSLVREPGGEVKYLLGMIEDISKLKQWEEEIRTYQERLRSLASELTLTEERERRRLATNLHDNIGQVLALTQIKLGALADAATSPVSQSEMTEVRNLITQVIHTTRFLTFELGSPILYELGLEEAVEALAENYENEYGLRITVEKEPLPVLPEAAASLLLFRALQELLTNVVKHARAQRVWVTLKMRDDRLTLQVKDDGKGFPAKTNGAQWFRHLGFGLFSLRERLSQLGGDLEVESRPGQGTSVRITIPLSPGNLVSH